jgi:hypothetical protein
MLLFDYSQLIKESPKCFLPVNIALVRDTPRDRREKRKCFFFLSVVHPACLPACRSLMEESGSLDIHQQSSSSTQLSAILL